MTGVTLPAGGAVIAVDTISAESHQLVKMEWGAAGAVNQVAVAAPLPTQVIMAPDIVASGTITATDVVAGIPAGAGVSVTGVPTAGSAVFVLSLGGDSVWIAQITGQTTGAIYFEGSIDSTNGSDGTWIALNGRQTGVVNTVLSNNATTGGIYRGNTSGLKYFRCRQTGTLTGTPAVLLRLADGVGAVFLNASIPGGANVIGKVGIDQTTPGTTNLVSLGAAVKAASTNVALTDPSVVVQDLNIGNQVDSSAGTDTGQFSLIALIKRLLTKVPVSGANTSVNALPVVLASDQANIADSQLIGNSAQLTLNNNLVIGSTASASDVLLYRSIGIQIVPAAGTVTAGVVTFEASNDNTNWQAVPLYDMISPAAAPVTGYTVTSATVRTFVGPLYFRYFRARISTGITGTTTGLQAFTRLSAQTHIPVQPSVFQSAAVNFQVTAALAAAQTLATVTTVSTVSASTPAAITAANLSSAATTNATSVKTSSARVWQITVTNIGAAVCFLKLYNKASAPVVGTDVPFETFSIPASGVPLNLQFGAMGMLMATGLAYAITNLIADADTTGIVAAQVKLSISYT